MAKNILLPDIGDFKDIEIIEILVQVGDEIEPETSLLSLESDKATIDIPSPEAGVVAAVLVKVGDKVSQGDPIISIEASKLETSKNDSPASNAPSPSTKSEPSISSASKTDLSTEVVILGGGPGGYSAAFRAADLGKKTILIERYDSLGGVCLNVGCIPSKALLHVAKVINDVEDLEDLGMSLKQGQPKPIRAWTESVIKKLTGGLKQIAKQRKVKVVTGYGKFIDPHIIEVSQQDKVTTIAFDYAIIAAGSQASMMPNLPDDKRIMDSTDALNLDTIPKRMLIIGGGIIGLEIATIYDALGTKITIVEMADRLMMGCDQDIVRPLQNRIKKRYENIYLNTSVNDIQTTKQHIVVSFSGDKTLKKDKFDAVLVAVGRAPNGQRIGAEHAGINVDERGFIPVDDQQHTNIKHIFAIGDIVGQPMLAHKATHEGKIAAEVIAGHNSAFLGRQIPSVAYTDPEVAWVGLTEEEAKKQNIDYGKGVFPWAASGRSLSINRNEGITKVLFSNETKHIIGAGIVGTNAGDLIAECCLAIEMGCDAEDIGLSIHPHPTLSETVGMAAEAFSGTITDLYLPKK